MRVRRWQVPFLAAWGLVKLVIDTVLRRKASNVENEPLAKLAEARDDDG